MKMKLSGHRFVMAIFLAFIASAALAQTDAAGLASQLQGGTVSGGIASVTVTGARSGGAFNGSDIGGGNMMGDRPLPLNWKRMPAQLNEARWVSGLANSPSRNCADSVDSPESPHPVIIATGEKVQRQDDFFDASLSDLSQVRTYRAFPSTRPARLFGPRWYSSFDYPKLEVSPTTIYDGRFPSQGYQPWYYNVSMPDGRTYQYQYRGWPMYYPNNATGGGSAAGYLTVQSTGNFIAVIIG